MEQTKTIAVVGAGIVGCSCALWLQMKGYRVVIIDPEQPGSGTSSGNACTIADYGCIPVNSPAIFKNLPGLMFAKQSPLSVDIPYAMKHMPWAMRFLANCRSSKVDYISRTLAGLLHKTYEGLDPLLDYCKAHAMLQRRGCLYVYQDDAEFQRACDNNRKRRELGFEFTEVNSDEVRELEPGMKKFFARGLLFEQATQVINPQSLTTKYFQTLLENGGEYVAANVAAISHNTDDLNIHLDQGENLKADRAVIACGAFSKQIKGVGTSQLPLDTERGYHIQYSGQQSLLTRPVSWNEAGFYATPMDEGLRIAGTVEIAGLKKERKPRHLQYLKSHAEQMFDLPEQVDQEWMGYRPTMPDALPVIGYSLGSEYVLYAFGHQHLGLTLSGITGKLVSELINNETPGHDIKAFSPRRFL